MSDRTPAATSEKTFSSFTKDQGANYAKNRGGYRPSLYKTIIDYHTSTGGSLDTLLDIGCGPGTVARELGPQFAHIIGLDPSEGMINNARDLVGVSPTSESIRFEISTAEDLGWHLSPPVKDSSVDLITAATAAHWFDMARFWPQAARILKPGGSVAIWTAGSPIMDSSMPNIAAMQAAMKNIWEDEIRPFIEPGNVLATNLYIDLPLPWTLSSPVAEFDEPSYFRKEWGTSNSAEEEYFLGDQPAVDMDRFEKVMSTFSPVQRWRDANPDAAGTDRDIVRMLRAEIERVLNEAGVEKGKEAVKYNMSGVLMVVKKKT